MPSSDRAPNPPATLRAAGLAALACVSVALLGADLWFAKERMRGYNYRLASYATIYYPAEHPLVQRFHDVGPGRLTMQLSPPPARGLALEGDAGARLTLDGARAALRVPEGWHDYALRPAGWDRGLALSIATEGGTVFSSSELLVGDVPRLPLSEHALRAEDFPPEQVARVRQLLAPAALAPGDHTWQRLAKLWALLYPQLDARRGEPEPWVHALPAFEQYRAIVEERRAVAYCSNFAVIYGLFAAVAGVPIRVVDANRYVPDGVELSAHTFTEVYVPELGRWVYSDMNLNIHSVRDGATGRHLNTVQLMHMHEAGALSGLVARVFQDGALVDRPYLEVGAFSRRFLNSNATFVFHRHYDDRGAPWAWLDRYLFRPELAYALYRDNGMHRAKLYAFWATVAVTLAWGALALRWWSRRRRA